jgi:oligoendopeptidase F
MNFLKLFIIIFVMVSLNACMDKSEETLELGKDINDLSSKEPVTWDLSDLYLDIESWNRSRSQISSKFSKIKDCEGKLGESSALLTACLDLINDTYKDLLKNYTYSFLAKDTDLGNSNFRERSSLSQALFVNFGEATSFLNPEIVSIGKTKLNEYIANDEGLKNHDFYIQNTLRQSNFILSPKEEAIIASMRDTMSTPSSAYEVLTNAEIPWPEVTLSNGKTVKLNPSGYGTYRRSIERNDRMLVFDKFWGTFQNYKQTLAITLQGQVKNDVAMAKIKGYNSSLDQALAEENIPIKVYETLVSSVNKGLPSLHRLIKLRQRMLGLETSEYYDIYPSVVSIDKKYSLEDAKQLTLEALKPLGKSYIDTLSNSLNKNWMHVYPAPGKRSGAYVMGAAYDVHPYVLLNFDNTLESVSTFIHEWGHAMHTLLANDAQSFEKADYSTFIAEIASTANEVLLFDHLRKNSKNDQQKLYFLFKELSQIRGTFFRQTQFAEFELAIHKLIEKGEALSADKLDRIYGDILKQYYGHNEGIMNIKDIYTVEWAYIPHFYRNFYVYQYATSISAAYFLTDKILKKEKGSKETLIKILKAGGSNYPFDILLNAGVDMSSEAVYSSIISRMEQLMDEVELILNK